MLSFTSTMIVAKRLLCQDLFQWIICKRFYPKWESKGAFGKLMFFKMAAMKHI